MSKGSYNVYNPVPTNSKNDNTFWKTFLCSSLVVLVIVLIFLLIALPIKRDLEGIKKNIYNAPERRYNSFRNVYSTTPESSKNNDFESTNPTKFKETFTDKFKEEVEDVDATLIENVTEKYMKLLLGKITTTENIKHHTETEAGVQSSTVSQNNMERIETTKVNNVILPDTTISALNTNFKTENSSDGTTSTYFTTPLVLPHTTTPLPDTQYYDKSSSEKVKEETKILTTPSQITKQEDNLQTLTENVSREIITEATKPLTTSTEIMFEILSTASDNKTTTENVYNSISTASTVSNHNKVTNEYEDVKTESSSNTEYSYETCQKILDEKQYCSTEDCKKISSRMLMSMSFTTDPCSDYYKYTCEGSNQEFINDRDYSKDVYKRIKDGLKEVNESSPYHLLLYKNYLTSCMNHAYSDPTEQVKEAFQSLKYIFAHEEVTADSSVDIPKLEILMVDLIRQNLMPFFDVYVDIGFGETTDLTSLVLQPVYFEDIFNDLLGDNKMYEKVCVRKLSLESPPDSVTYDSFYFPYHQCKRMMFFKDLKRALLIVDGSLSDEQYKHLSHDFANLLFDKMVTTKIVDKKIILADKKYETLSIAFISKEIPDIDWEFIFTNLLKKNVNETNISVNVYHFDYLKDLLTFDSGGGMTTNVSRRLHNTLLALYAYKLYKDFILSQSHICDQSDYCHSLANKLMNDVSSSLYMKSFIDSEFRYMHSRATGIFYQTRSAYLSIKNSPWNKHMKYDINKPITLLNYKPWTNKYLFTQRFTMIKMSEDNFIQNTIDLEKRYRHLNYETFNKSVYEPDILWSLVASPTDNTLSHFLLNDSVNIVVPLAAIPRMDTFNDVPSYIIMSDLSYKIAKEIIYCILSPKSRVNDNVRDLFNYSIPFSLSNKNNEESTVYLNTSSSSRDLFSSVYGAWISYDAYIVSKYQGNKPNQTLIWQKDSADQLFFLHLSQAYCKKESILENPVQLFESDRLPPLFTVNSIMRNNHNFGILYNCSATPMANAIKTSDQDYGSNYVDVEG